MASVTQSIPSLNGGISQQPDELKIPGQVNVAKNVLPDVTNGLRKRPGGLRLGSLTDDSDAAKNSVPDGKFFSYYRDENESYIGQIRQTTGEVTFWNKDGSAADNVYYGAKPWVSGNKPHKLDDLVAANNNIYRCVQAGRTGTTAPSGTGTNISDNTCRWDYEQTQASAETALKNYLKHTSDEQLQTLTVNDYTFVTNRNQTVQMLTGTNDREPERPDEAYLFLKANAYARQYSVNLFDSDTELQEQNTVTRIRVELVGSSNNYGTTFGFLNRHSTRDNWFNYNDTHSSGDQAGLGVYGPTDASAGAGNDAFCPNVGTELFDITDGGLQCDRNAVGGRIYDSSSSQSPNPGVDIGTQTYGSGSTESTGNNFKYNIQVRNGTTYTSSDTNVSDLSGSSARTPRNLYFRITTTGQSVPYQDGSDTTYKCRYTTTWDLLHGGDGWKVDDWFYVWMRDAYVRVIIEEISHSDVQGTLTKSDGSYEDGRIRPTPTPFDTETAITTESILGKIRQPIISTDAFTTANVQMIGNGIYLRRTNGLTNNFNISTPAPDLINAFTDEVNDITELPDQCKHGYVVKIANSKADEDDYYVKFIGKQKDDGTFIDGYGVWEECNKPGRNIAFDKTTMPIQIVSTSPDTFVVSFVDWDKSEVGDEYTNPEPSFVGSSINQLLFFRNRLVMLSEENVIMSRPGDFFNFWSKSATTFTPLDMIDLSCSSKYPAVVQDGIQINTGLLLFTENQQFMLTTDSDILSPETAKINSVSSYGFNKKTSPITLGTTVAFCDNANKFTRFFEMANIERQGEPDVIEQSKVVSNLLDKDINLISNSRENSIVFFSKKTSPILYGFKYFTQGDNRVLQSWFTWEMHDSVVYHCFLDDSLYVVTFNSDAQKHQLLKYSFKLADDEKTVEDTQGTTTDTTDDRIYRVHLDNVASIRPSATYNATSQTTTMGRPTSYLAGAQLAAYKHTSGGNDIGRFAKITVNTSGQLVIPGDWTSGSFLLGYLYDMEVELPTFYVTRPEGSRFVADTKGSLIIHRVKVNYGPLGSYTTTVKRLGKDDYSQDISLAIANNIATGILPTVEESEQTVACYERNKNLTVKLKSTHPAPGTIYSYSWEGDYTNRFYRRV